jgi:cellulose synthase operon protein C
MKARLAFLLLRPLLGLAVLASACATTTTTGLWSVPPAAQVRLLEPQRAPSREAQALAERFYTGAAPLAEVEGDLERLLEQQPGSALLHEVAAYAAVLRSDEDAAWEHFLRAAQDPTSPVAEHALAESMVLGRTAGQRKASIQFFKDLVERHPSGAVRARAAYYLIGDLVAHDRLAEIPAARRALGFLDAWQVMGSFDNDQGKAFLTAFAPEEGVDLEEATQGARLPIRWREVQSFTQEGLVPLGWVASPAAHAAAYLVTWVKAPADMDAELRLTTTTSARAWLNGGLVLSEERIDRVELDNLRVPVRLQRGWNQLLVKSATKAGPWSVGARLTDESGAPLEGLVATSQPQSAPTAAGQAAPASMRVPAGLASLPEGPRRALLEARAYQVMGHVRPAVDALQGFLEQHPTSLPALYYTSIALWADDEEGRALDLVNRAVRDTDGKASRFLQRRASFYAHKDLFDKAQADLLAVRRLTKRARSAETDLATVYARRGFGVERCEVLEDVLARWPDDASASRDAALCWRGRGFDERGLELHKAARRLEPGNAWNLDQLRELSQRRLDLSEALFFVREQRRFTPERLRLLVDEADLLRWRGDSDGAEALYLEAAKKSPDWAVPRERLGTLARERGNEQVALDHLKAAIERAPEDSQLADLLDFLEPAGEGLAMQYAPSLEDVERAVASADSVTPRSGAHVVTLLEDEVTEVSQEGTAKRVVTQVSLAVSEAGRDQLIQARVPSDGRVRILSAYSMGIGGERQEASSIRGGIVRFRQLTAGSVVVLQYVHYAHSKRFLPNHFVAERYLQGVNRQVVSSRWTLILPKDRHLSVDVHKDVQQREEKVGASLVRTFSSADVPPLLPERYMPNPRDLLLRVSVSTVRGWDEYVQWERALLSQVFRLDAETAALARRLTDGAKTPRERFDRLYHYAAQDIRYQQDYENSIAGVRPHACPVVLSRGYGDCKDKAVLLILLAKQVGIDVDFAILRTTDAGEVIESIPNQQFNHAIVYVPAQEGIEDGFFMDPTTDALDIGNLRSDDQGALSLVLDPDSGSYRFVRIPYHAPEMERSLYRFDVDVASARDAKVALELEARGGSGSQVRKLLRNKEQAKQFYQGLAQQLFPGSLVTEATASDPADLYEPAKVELTIDAGAALQRQGDAVRLKLPEVFPLAATATLAERQHPLKLGAPESYRTELTVRLPQGTELLHVPEPMSVRHECFIATRTLEKKRDEVKVVVDYRRTCTEISTEDYGAYRARVQEAHQLLNDHLLFKPPLGKMAAQ